MHKTLVDLVDNRVITTLKENSVDIPKENVDVLIIGHGSKDPNSGISIDYVVDELKPSYRNVSRCYLEIEGPTIEEGIQACEKNNPEVLIIVFYFLHEGAHVKIDVNNDLLPALDNANLKKTFVTKHLGADEKMIDLILERAREVENAN
ncbi:MAG: cobalamin biosynthesis protein CbiX [Thaumarchaeota archaeon]|nr:cobalamin biosynthesis protein CbiX [Nitrososphaerota archaeon]